MSTTARLVPQKPEAPIARPAPPKSDEGGNDSDEEEDDDDDDDHETSDQRLLKKLQSLKKRADMKSDPIFRVRLSVKQKRLPDAEKDTKLKKKEKLAADLGGERMVEGGWFFKFSGEFSKETITEMIELFGAPVPESAVDEYKLLQAHHGLDKLVRNVVDAKLRKAAQDKGRSVANTRGVSGTTAAGSMKMATGRKKETGGSSTTEGWRVVGHGRRR